VGPLVNTATMTVLETDRLILRPLTGDDFADYAAMLADPQVTDGLAETVGNSPEEAWRSLAMFIGHRAIRGYSHWALVEKSTGEFVGRAGPWRPHGFPGLGIGWCLAREHWGKGYATEAAQASLNYALKELGAPEVISLVLPNNSRSIAVAERIGHRHLRDVQYRGRNVHLYGQRPVDASTR
jgi:ribosomal-protein-alanine N-acetyltransferase